MRFAKYHGTGNDFVLIEDMADRLSFSPELIVAVCDRRRGVGADGLIRIAPAEGADFFMDHSNSDGLTAEMCGNGIRCLAKYVYERGLTTAREIDVLTRSGVKHLVLEVQADTVRTVTVDMGPPELQRKAIPMTGDPIDTFIDQSLVVDGRTYPATALSMGNPHVVLFLEPQDDLRTFPVPVIGPLVEGREEFPSRTNVEFVKVVDGRIHARVWERGVGETMACGTGACAALVACAITGRTGREAELEYPGGVLQLELREDDHVFLTGPAVCVFDGDLDEAWLAAVEEGSP